MQRLARVLGQRLGQETPSRPRQRQPEQREKHEDRPPAGDREQACPEQRRHRRRQREDQHHPRHQALRLRPLVQVAHHRAPDHDAGTAADPLQRAPQPQAFDGGRQRADQRRKREHRGERDQHATAAKAVGKCTVPQHHQPECAHVHGERLLHIERAGTEFGTDRREGRQVGVDRERPDRGQRRQQGCEAGVGDLFRHGRLAGVFLVCVRSDAGVQRASRLRRYWIASATCAAPGRTAPARSASVRATRSTR